MNRRQKVELFEQIRREFEFGVGTIAGVARKFGIHRRLVRQALDSPLPPPRKTSNRKKPRLDPLCPFIDEILLADLHAPRKQRHTAHRIYSRLLQQLPHCQVSERSVRRYVSFRKRELGLVNTQICVPQSYHWGQEAQVDWYEADVFLDGQPQTLQFFVMRSMASGAAFHCAYLRATQQAFLQAHQLAFHYFGGVFHRLRYDNLKSAVKKVLRGHQRQESERFLLFGSHWQFESSFCNPASGHEKGGVEGEVGYFRRNHLVPVPEVATLGELNSFLLDGCKSDLSRRIELKTLRVGEALSIEREHLLPLQMEDFDLAEESFLKVDSKGCVCVGTNFYSTGLRVGTQARVRVLPSEVEILDQGRVVATHQRCYQRCQQLLSLEHYLDVLERKPGAFAGSKPLEQWRAEGRWTKAYDRMFEGLKQRLGTQAGTREMIQLLQLGRQHGYEALSRAIEEALGLGTSDGAVVRYLLSASSLDKGDVAPLLPEEVLRADYYARPQPEVAHYDELLKGAEVSR